jgi:hypothetical protein
MLRRDAQKRRLAGKAAGPKVPSIGAGRSSACRATVGFALGAGLVLGVGLFVLLDVADRGRDALTSPSLGGGLAAGCTVLALDRDNSRTQAEPCPDFAPQVVAAIRAPPPIPTAN